MTMTVETGERPQKRLKGDKITKDEEIGNITPEESSVSLTNILFSESVAAKLWRVASRALGKVSQ